MTRVYAKDPELNLFHHAMFDGIAYSDGDEVERRIHEAVRRANDRGTFSVELARAISDWPSEYHLSRQRHCLVRPLGIERGHKVLELGCGCGAITRFLGELGAEVTAVEGSLQRARIASERCRDLPNVKVIADDLLQFQTDERFDWVLLIGVLEYAPVFSPEKDPVGHYLRKVRPFLSPRGRLVVAIENKLGLKYFNGCAEDHLGVPFYGVQGLYGANTPRTFGRRELETHIRAAGLDHAEFLYPLPDYKLPRVVLSEAALSDPRFDPADLLAFAHARDYGGNPHRLFDEALVWREAARNGLLGELSNSFLVIASQQPAPRARETALAVAYSAQRVAEFAMQTRFVRGGKTIRVIKEPLGPGPRRRSLADGVVLENTPGEAAYVRGRLSIWRLWEARARRADLPQIVEALAPWFDFLVSQATALPARGGLAAGHGRNIADFVLPGRHIDLTPFNLMEAGEQLVPIDTEWTIDHDIPLGWVVTRSVVHSLLGAAGFERPVKIADVITALCLRRGFDVSEEDIDQWLRREGAFVDAVNGPLFPVFPVSASSQHLVPPYELLAERESQVAALGQAIAERGRELGGLRDALAERDAQIGSLNHALAERDGQLISLSGSISEIYSSHSWQITKPMRFVGRQLRRARHLVRIISMALAKGGGVVGTVSAARRVVRREGLIGLKRALLQIHAEELIRGTTSTPVAINRKIYGEWVQQYDTLNDDDRAKIREHIAAMRHKPLISVVMPTYNPNQKWLIEAIESVRMQIYPHWELCIADDASTNKEFRSILERYAKNDSRIKIVFRERNGHISAASNSALELAAGEWVALLDHDDLLNEHALFWVADAIHQKPDVRLIYSDEDKIDEVGRRFDPYFKCDWNVDLFYSHNLITHLGVYRADLLKDIGGFREGLEGAQDYDLALRCVERIEPKQIHHIPRVLYHWRMHAESTAQSSNAKPYAMLAGKRALNEHFQRQKINARAEFIGHGYRVIYALPDNPPMVSLIIPTRNGLGLIRQCVESIVKKTRYPNYEILIVDNGSDDPTTLRYFDELQAEARVRVVHDDRPFNYSALNNTAVKLARGEMMGLLNNDLEVVSPDWLSEMVSIALQPRVGAVGARLWYPNETLQHGGVILGVGGVAGHSHRNLPRVQYGYFSRASLTQSFSAVTAACLVIRKEIYEEVGGLNETDLQVAFNDIDFCLRVREAGYRNVWTPYAELYHHESATRGYEDTPEKLARFAKEAQYMKQRWGNLLLNDPAYSPNLTLDHGDFSLAWPPRVKWTPFL